LARKIVGSTWMMFPFSTTSTSTELMPSSSVASIRTGIHPGASVAPSEGPTMATSGSTRSRSTVTVIALSATA
jgi:hypothetical protein